MTRLLIAIAVFLSACTPAEVSDWFQGALTEQEAAEVAEWVNDRDCLPAYDEGLYLECAVADAAGAYRVDVDTLAALVWCESRFDPDARNPRSSAVGLAQFLTGTWEWVESLGAPWAHLPRTHARANVFTAAWLIDRDDLGGISHWDASAGCRRSR